LRLLFSDLDGTCVHYSDSLPFTLSLVDDGSPDIAWNATFEEGESSAVLPLPPSSSGSQGIISTLTLQGYAQLRSRGVKLVLISGCRSSTLFERLACLPAADAYVCESGGRIFYPSTALPTAVGLVEDKTWRLSQKAAGPPGQEGVPVLERVGLLWDEYRRLSAQGLHLDARNYTTAFRVRVKTPEDMKSASGDALPPGLAAAVNLGAVDIYPATSGKKSAAQYLMRRFGGSKDGSDSVCMCGELLPSRFLHALQSPGNLS